MRLQWPHGYLSGAVMTFITEACVAAATPELQASLKTGLLLRCLFIVAGVRWSAAAGWGERIQGLVLLANRRLMLVELGGFVNNACSVSPSVCACWQVATHTLAIFFFYLWVCLFFFFFDGVFMDGGYRARYCVSTSLWFYVACAQAVLQGSRTPWLHVL